MAGQRWVLAGIAAALLAGSGCVACGHRGYDIARTAGTACDLPACQRNQVHVFAMSSLNPVSMMALDGLAQELNQQGFAKVATGQTIHVGWMAREMRRIHEDEPEAVFVVVGFESAGPVAVRLAEKMAGEGLAIGGLVVIDSEGTTAAPLTAIRTLAIGKTEGITTSDTVETVAVSDAASYGLATDSRTTSAMGKLLTDLASAVPVPTVVEVTQWDYPQAPPMRVTGDPSRSPEWMFLFDSRPGAKAVPATSDSSPVILPVSTTQRGTGR